VKYGKQMGQVGK